VARGGSGRRKSRHIVLVAGAGLSLLAAAGGAPEPPVPIPVFVEVSGASGISFHHISGGEEDKPYIFETKGAGICTLDYDNDGLLDLYLAQGSTLDRFASGRNPHGSLFRNLGNWKFEDVTESAGLTVPAWGMGVTAADFDNDGHVDLYLTNLGPNILYHNDGDGTFHDVTGAAGVGDARWSTSASFADYDADGLLDLFVPNYLDVGPGHLPKAKGSAGCAYRGRPVMCGPHGLPGAANVLYHNEGDGTFIDVSERTGVVDPSKYYGLGSVWGDLDNDGDLDLYVANDATPNQLFVNEGNGHFTEQGFPSGLALSGTGLAQASMGVDLGDYDNDGLLDVYSTHFAGDYSTLYHNEGGLFFEDVTARAGILLPDMPLVKWGTRFVDLNNDGWKDIFHTNGHTYPSLDRDPMDQDHYRQPQTLYLNLHDGKFLDASALAGPALQEPHVGRGAAFADLDNDGDIDIAVAQMNGSPLLFRNDAPGGNHWVMFRTVGRQSDRDGIGARLTVTAGGLQQIWEIKRALSIYSCSDPRAHFGLGAASRIERLEVRWPSGKVQVFRDVPADRHYLVDEEGGLSEERLGSGG